MPGVIVLSAHKFRGHSAAAAWRARGGCWLLLAAAVLFAVGSRTAIALGGHVRGREIRIKVLDGRTGNPVAGACVNVALGLNASSPADSIKMLATGIEGVAVVRLAETAGEISEPGRTSNCRGGGTAPTEMVAQSGATIIIAPANYADCRPHNSNQATILYSYPVKRVLDEGIVLENSCGKVTISPKPGELILFVRPMRWWDRFRQ